MSNPEVSVIIPTRNRAQYLPLAVQSVLDQTFKNFEIVVVDDASIDNTKETVSNFSDERVHCVYRSTQGGPSAARNSGIRRSQGETLAFLDDDDLWRPSKLEKQLTFLRANPHLSVVSSGVWTVDVNSAVTRYFIPPFDDGSIYPEILRGNFVGNPSMVILRKKCFEKVGMFEESLPAHEDFDMWIRLAKHYQFGCVREYLTIYQPHKEGITANFALNLTAKKMLFHKYSSELKAMPDHGKAEGLWHFDLGELYCRNGDVELGKREFASSIVADPFSPSFYAGLFASLFGLRVFEFLVYVFLPLLPSLRERFITKRLGI